MISVERQTRNYWRRVQVRGLNDCWPWIGARNRKGYGAGHWGRSNPNAHRIAWILAHGEIPKGMHCLHRCDNPACQNPRHLFVGTNLDNIADKMMKGRHRGARGERSGSAKLKGNEVLEIISRYAAGGITQKELAKEFGISEGYVSTIIIGRTWKHLERRMAAHANGK